MKILTALTYYRPHISGLTIYAERLCRALARRGHQITILTSQYDKSLPRLEKVDGIQIIRVPVTMRISKGVIMPTIGLEATHLVPRHDIVHLHLPQLDAAGIALRGSLFRIPTVLTYHCDLALPPSTFHWIVQQVVQLANRVAAHSADAIVTSAADYAQSSSLLSRYESKVKIISPPIEIDTPTAGARSAFLKKFGIEENGPIIGVVGRLAAEKGIEFLLQALPAIQEQFPRAIILHVGPKEPVGEAGYLKQLAPLLEQNQNAIRFLGVVTNEELAAFYSLCTVHVLPSFNSTESFGLVQVEAAQCGTPTVATDLPGIRSAIQQTGMGLVVPPRNPTALAEAICEIIRNRSAYLQPVERIKQIFSPDLIAEKYESLFLSIKN